MTSATDQPAPCVTRDGLAMYSFGRGAPVFLMPGPHRFQQPGLRTADALIDGLTGLGRQVNTFDPPGSGRSTRPGRACRRCTVCRRSARRVRRLRPG